LKGRLASRLWWLPLMATGLLGDRDSRGRWLCVPGLVAFTAFVSTSGKVTIRRPRPSLGDGSRPIGRLGLASSFPSTHAACGFAIAGWLWRSRQRNWLHLLAATVGYARVRGRAHHLLDVLAGGTLGYAIGRCADSTWEALRAATGSGRERTRSAAVPALPGRC
jgi:membrane-associated phospholipid phosphatase